MTNQPDMIDTSSSLEQLLTPRTRDVLAARIRENLNNIHSDPIIEGRNA